MRDTELILYRLGERDVLIRDMARLMEAFDLVPFYDVVNRILEMAAQNGFYGNLWHCCLTDFLLNHENAYSLGCEIHGESNASLKELVLHDFEIISELYHYDFNLFPKGAHKEVLSSILEFKESVKGGNIYNDRIRSLICETAVMLGGCKKTEDFGEIVTKFYEKYGVGKFGLHKAFRIQNQNGKTEVVPIRRITHVNLDDLVGYEIAKKKLIENTEAFVEGRRANNCLLFGDAGTGKSSSIKAIINQYYDQGLRIIEIYKHQFQELNEVLAQVKNRNYKFIIYMDDLSFEENELEYKYLKAVIEGGMEKKPDHVLIYATSNRRHLIRETFRDKEDRREGDIHTGDTVQEKLSLVARFGVTIYFEAPMKKEFQQIVLTLAKKNQVEMADEEILAEANKWELYHGGMSGRSAQQFIDYLLGTKVGK